MISLSWGASGVPQASDERTYAARRAGHPTPTSTISFTPSRYSPQATRPRRVANTRAENAGPAFRGTYRVHISEENLAGSARTQIRIW